MQHFGTRGRNSLTIARPPGEAETTFELLYEGSMNIDSMTYRSSGGQRKSNIAALKGCPFLARGIQLHASAVLPMDRQVTCISGR